MKTITIVIEVGKDCIGVYSEVDEGIFGTGQTIEECKQSVQELYGLTQEEISEVENS